MAEVEQYKCPACGGTVEFDSRSQQLKCPFCDSEFSIEAMQEEAEIRKRISADDKMDGWDTRRDTPPDGGDAQGMCAFLCQSCGGEVIGDENMGATTCPFCGNHIVISGKFSQELKPDLVIPFRLDRKAAKETLQKYLSDKSLLPKVFREENHIDEIRGIYVPFWLYDAQVDGVVKFSATKVRSWSTKKYNYVETRHYDVLRKGFVAFENIPVDASSKMPDDLMDSLEPFDFGDAVDFHTAYLAGYLADKFDVTAEDNIPRINVRVKRSTEEVFRSTVLEPYATLTTDNSFIELRGGSAKYALLPVWLLNTTWNGEKYIFAMNGQTGKFVGNLPIDRGLCFKKWLGTFATSLPVGAIVGYIVHLLLR